MPLRRRRAQTETVAGSTTATRPSVPPDELVRFYLRAQNLEQIREVDQAIVLYERAVGACFDAAGPYDRLIAIYGARDAHGDVQRIAEAALTNVRTHADKRDWYESVRAGATEAQAAQRDARGAEF